METVLNVALWVVGLATGAGLAGVGIKALATWAKGLKWVEALHLEALIDSIAEGAIHCAEAWGRNYERKGLDKLTQAIGGLMDSLEKYGIKMTPGAAEKRVESVLNKLKSDLALYEAPREEAKNGSTD